MEPPTIKPSSSSQNLVCFNFTMKRRYYNFIQTPNSPSPDFLSEETRETFAGYKQTVKESTSDEEMAVALDGVLGTLIRSRKRKAFVEDVVEDFRGALRTAPLCRFKMKFDYEIEAIIRRNARYVSDDVDESRAKSSIRSLDKFEEQRCSICLEEFGGGKEVVATVCGHVFQWRSTSRCCPLCRFEEPIETS